MDALMTATGHVECVELRQLPPLTAVLVWTKNSLYRVTVLDGSSVSVQGGPFFTDPTPAQLTGASIGRGFVLDGLICLGLQMEIQTGDTRTRTSPVVALATESAGDSIVH